MLYKSTWCIRVNATSLQPLKITTRNSKGFCFVRHELTHVAATDPLYYFCFGLDTPLTPQIRPVYNTCVNVRGSCGPQVGAAVCDVAQRQEEEKLRIKRLYILPIPNDRRRSNRVWS